MADEKETPVFAAQAAADEIERMARLYEPLVSVAASLRTVASLDNLIAERTAKGQSLQRQLDELNDKLQEETDKYNDAVEAAENFVRQRNREADDQLANARQQAEGIITDAQAQAERITKDAQTRLNLLREDIELAGKQRQAAIESNTQLSLDHAAEVQKRENELIELTAKITQAREQIAKMLGGA